MKAKKATGSCIAVITFFLIVLPLVAFLSYSSAPGGIKSNILLSIPEEKPIAIAVSMMMFLSCLFTYPIYSVQKKTEKRHSQRCAVSLIYSIFCAQIMEISEPLLLFSG